MFSQTNQRFRHFISLYSRKVVIVVSEHVKSTKRGYVWKKKHTRFRRSFSTLSPIWVVGFTYSLNFIIIQLLNISKNMLPRECFNTKSNHWRMPRITHALISPLACRIPGRICIRPGLSSAPGKNCRLLVLAKGCR